MSKSGNTKKIKQKILKKVSEETNCPPLIALKNAITRDKQGLLFFIDNTPDDNSTGISEQESINKFTTAYNNLNHLSKTYVNTLTQILINTIDTNNSFEGVVFSSFPNYIKDGNNLTRIDCYDPATQKLHICLSDNPMVLEHVLKAEVEAITVFQHEETHAIDDNYSNISLPNSIIKITNYCIENPNKKATVILTLASNLISKKTALQQDKTILTKEYLDPYIENIATSLKTTNTKVTLGDIYNYYDESKLSQNNNEPKPKAKYTPLLEFVTFHGEKIFEYLKSSSNTKEFKQKYKKNLDNFCTNVPGTKKDKQLALELIKVTSEDFLEKVIDTLPTQDIAKEQQELKASLVCINPMLTKAIEQCKEVKIGKGKPSLKNLKRPVNKISIQNLDSDTKKTAQQIGNTLNSKMSNSSDDSPKTSPPPSSPEHKKAKTDKGMS